MKKISFILLVSAFLFSWALTISQAGERDGVTDKEVLIGGLGPITGPASNLGVAIEYGAKSAVKLINDAGGVHGRKINYIMGDTVCGSSQGLAITKKLISSDKVFALQGLACSHVGMAIRPTVDKEKVPLIVTTAQSPNILRPFSKYLFRILPPNDLTGHLMGKFMWVYFNKKYTKVAIIHTQEEYGATGKDGLVEQLQKYGIKPLAIETHKIGDTDFNAQLLKIKGTNPEVLFILSYVKDMALIVKQAYEQGLNCVKIGYMGSDFAMIPVLAGKAALKDYYGPTSLLDTIRGPQMQTFNQMYEKAYPEYMKNPNNPSSSDISSHVSIHVYAEALKRAGKDLTRTKFISALESIKNFKYPGYPPITFSPTQHEGVLQEKFLRYVDGEAQVLDIEVKMD